MLRKCPGEPLLLARPSTRPPSYHSPLSEYAPPSTTPQPFFPSLPFPFCQFLGVLSLKVLKNLARPFYPTEFFSGGTVHIPGMDSEKAYTLPPYEKGEDRTEERPSTVRKFICCAAHCFPGSLYDLVPNAHPPLSSHGAFPKRYRKLWRKIWHFCIFISNRTFLLCFSITWFLFCFFFHFQHYYFVIFPNSQFLC